MDVQALLKSKNRCLSQLISVTEDALSSAVASGSDIFDSGLTSILPVFDQSRSAIFRAIELVDREISKAAPRTQPSPALREELKTLVSEQQALIKNLQSLDTRLLEILDSALQSGQRSIQQQLQSREKLNRFKSQQVVEAGEGLDQKL